MQGVTRNVRNIKKLETEKTNFLYEQLNKTEKQTGNIKNKLLSSIVHHLNNSI